MSEPWGFGNFSAFGFGFTPSANDWTPLRSVRPSL
jgi:hypothetical protein